MTDAAPAPPAGDRHARAQALFEHDLDNQREWYSKRAATYRTRAALLAMAVIAAGATTSFLQVFSGIPWIPIATAALGACVVLIQGWQSIARYDETWKSYRAASERMKREFRLYVNGAGGYRGTDEVEAFRLFVEAIEAIIAEEQQLYWRARAGDKDAANHDNGQQPQQH